MIVRWWPSSRDVRIASVRLRCHVIIEYLRKAGVDAGLYRAHEQGIDALVLSKRYDPATIKVAEGLRRKYGTHLLLDLCDNHLHLENPTARLEARAANLRRAVVTVDRVIASTGELGTVISQCTDGAKVEVIGDAIENPHCGSMAMRWLHPTAELRLALLARALDRAAIPVPRRLVWFGSHGSPGVTGGMLDVLPVIPAITAASRKGAISLTVISNSRAKFETLEREAGFPMFYLPWERGTFSRALSLHSAAIVPVSKNPFTLCKTNNRLATSLVHGLNVIADGIPSYREFGAYTVLDDWTYGLGDYLADVPKRQAHVESGRQQLMSAYDISAIGGRWLSLLVSVRAQSDFARRGASSSQATS